MSHTKNTVSYNFQYASVDMLMFLCRQRMIDGKKGLVELYGILILLTNIHCVYPVIQGDRCAENIASDGML